jgi:hypothetical protein
VFVSRTCGSCVAVERQRRSEFLFVLKHPDPLSTGLLKSLKNTGSVSDKRAKGRKRAVYVCKEDVIGEPLEAVKRSTRKSVPSLAQQIGVATSTADRISFATAYCCAKCS